jgi:hypothetical protein
VAVALDLDPKCDEAQRLLSCGLAELVEDSVFLTHPSVAEIVTRSTDQLSDVQMILRVVESTSATIDELAAVLGAALEEDYRDLGIAVVTHLLDKGLQRHMLTPASSPDLRRSAVPATPG